MKTWSLVFSAMILSAVVEVSAQAGPPAPTLNTPAQAAVSVALSPNLSWNASTGATSYRVQLATDSLFTALLVDDSTVVTTSRAVGPLTSSTVYYWRVRAKNGSGVSAFSAYNSFTTIIALPGTPFLTAPGNNATNVAIAATLTWNATANASSYHIQLGTDSTFATTVVNDSIDTTNSLAVSLVNGNTYYWHVSAKDVAGAGAYSARRAFTTFPDTTPAAPTLTAPANNAANQADSLALTWAATAGATSYRVQVSSDSTFSSTFVVNDSTVTTNTRSVAGLTNGDTLYWRVNAKNAFGTSAFSARRVFSTVPAIAPAAPTLTAPANAATNQADSVALTWAASAGAVTYRVQASRDSNFASTFYVNDSTVTTLTRSVTGLVNGDTVYWRVNAKNAFGTSAFSTRRSFLTVPATAPTVPTLTAPANAAVNQLDSLNFTWAASVGAATYRIQVSTDSNFASTFAVNDSTVATNARIVTGLVNGNTYYWRVNAKNTFGTSAFSTRRSFSTLPAAAPAAPALNTPANAATNVAVSSNLTWTASLGALSYGLQLSTDSTFATTLLNDSGLVGSPLAVGPLANATVYYWRANAKNTFGTSAFSASRSFTTVALVAPGTPALTAPANNANNIGISTKLVWNPVAVATSYHVQLATDTGFTTIILDDSGLVSDTLPVGSLVTGTVYYWHVSAKNSVGSSAYSGRRTFSTVTSIPPAPTLVSPAQNATNVIMPALFTWNAASGAATYNLQLSKDSTFATGVTSDTGLAGTSTIVTGISNDGSVYYWHVNAMNAVGTSDYSAKGRFTLIKAPTAPPVLSTPANNATGVALATTLTWAAAVGATTYHVQLSADSGFASTLVDDSTDSATSLAVGPLPGSTVFYWRVSARNAAGSSTFSARFSYTATAGIPTSPALSTPANNAISVAVSTSLTWTASPGAKTYRVQLSTDSTFTTTFVVNDSTVTTTTRAVGPLTSNTRYFWRVNAKDSLGTSSFSGIRAFTTTTVIGILPQGFALERLTSGNGDALRFALPSRSHVDITLFDSQGRLQEKLMDEDKDAGNYTLTLPAANLRGADYFLEFRTAGFHKTLMLHF